MICQNCIHSEVCKHKTEAVYECEHFKEVVMCKDCKFCSEFKDLLLPITHRFCCYRPHNFAVIETDFCSRGVRKESEVTE